MKRQALRDGSSRPDEIPGRSKPDKEEEEMTRPKKIQERGRGRRFMRRELLGILCMAAGLALEGCGGKTLSSIAESANSSSEEISEDTSDSSSDAVSTESSVMTDTDTDPSAYTMTEADIPKENGSLYGRLYMPEENKSNALVIMSHGFGGSFRNVEDYAVYFAENGIASFAFDFTGGGNGSKSGGSTTDMSVLTEAEDLDSVLDYFRDDAAFDNSRLFLLGESQGGFVSTYVAGTRPEDVAGLIALYPAYVLQDDSRKANPDPENGPDERSLMGVLIGRIYDEDAQSFDIYDVMKNYQGRVLIIHGTEDPVVPVAYAERAEDTFPDAELVELDGAGHGFYGSDEKEAAETALRFINGILEEGGEQTDASGSPARDTALEEDAGQSAFAAEDEEMTMVIGKTPVQVQWEDNDAVKALRDLVKDGPFTVQMSMYGGFEQVGDLGQDLPRADTQTTTEAGDIVLYSGDKIVVFYGSNTWDYTRLGRITDKTADEMTDLLDHTDVTITIAEN